MPLLRQQDLPELPSMRQVEEQGVRVYTQVPYYGTRIDVGLLNMMPDRALVATERQFLRLLAGHKNRFCAIHPFSIRGVPRGEEGAAHLRQYYQDCPKMVYTKLDALVITGANVTEPELNLEPFWAGLKNVLVHADRQGIFTLCSCLAAHAAIQIFHGISRTHLEKKKWGIFWHHIEKPDHPLVAELPKDIEMPHSRFNDVFTPTMESSGIQVLIAADDNQMLMGAEPDGRRIYFQGHPEYDDISLLKEYKREILRYLSGERDNYPEVPKRAFTEKGKEIAARYRGRMTPYNNKELKKVRHVGSIESFPEEELAQEVNFTWGPISQFLFRNWLQAIARDPELKA